MCLNHNIHFYEMSLFNTILGTINIYDKNWEKKPPQMDMLTTAGWDINIRRNSLAVSQKVKHGLSIWSRNSVLGCTFQRKESSFAHYFTCEGMCDGHAYNASIQEDKAKG